jgi:hypothetical protein
MTFNRARWWGLGAAVVLAAGGIAAAVTMMKSGVDPEVSGPPVTRRLTAVQYRNIIRDVFGADIDIGGRLPPDLRVDGLLAIGASHVSITAAGMEQYDAMARAIAAQVVDENHREMLVRCQPASVTGPDEDCAGEFLARAGRLLYRRSLTDEQLETYVTAASEATRITRDFYDGIKLSLSAMLSSPAFLFRVQVVEPDPDEEGAYRLDAYTKASQLSFFLWNSAPDSQLLSAAESGDLHARGGLEEQVERMIDSPRLQAGIRAFFADQLRFTEFSTLAKDAQLFPKFSAQVGEDAREQTLRTIIDVVLTEDRDFREIFTTKKTFMTPALGAIYRVPIYKEGPNGSPDEWQPYEFAADDPRAGILTQVAFTALHSPAGRGSPTIRGKAVREIALCQEVPAPPGDVDFTQFLQAAANPTSTARERLSAHSSVPSCAGCHKIMDPIGLALENFDGAGGYRTTEGGVPIDASGLLDGIAFENAAGLGAAVYKNPAAVSCLVNRLSARALGRPVASGERNWLDYLKTDFEDSGYRLLGLMQEIALSEALYSVSPSQQVASASAENNREFTQ